jgi:nicotinate (nicotinamide) nucleotide adenylyltransferase
MADARPGRHWAFSAALSTRFISAICVSPKKRSTAWGSPASAGFRPASRRCVAGRKSLPQSGWRWCGWPLPATPASRSMRAKSRAARPSYTVTTLERLRATEGAQLPLVLLLGADAFARLPGWHRWQSLFALAHLAVAHRPGFPIAPDQLPAALANAYRERLSANPAALAESPAGRIVTFAMTQLAISATQIRALLANRRSVRYLLPDEVIAYIRRQHLYQES